MSVEEFAAILALGEHTVRGLPQLMPRRFRYDARCEDAVPAHRENWLPQLCCHPLQCFGAGANTPLDLSHF